MDHLDRDLKSRFARHEDDTAPVSRSHATDVMTREADAAHDVALEEPHPVCVRDFLEGLWLEDPHVDDEYVELGIGGDHLRAALGTREVCRHAHDVNAIRRTQLG